MKMELQGNSVHSETVSQIGCTGAVVLGEIEREQWIAEVKKRGTILNRTVDITNMPYYSNENEFKILLALEGYSIFDRFPTDM